MSNQTETILNDEIERLRQKNSELLTELKQSKARVKELESQNEAGGTELQTMKTELMNLKLNHPVTELLNGVLVSAKYSAMELAEHYKFEINDEGKVEMRELDGTPVQVKEKVDGKEVSRPVRFEENDIWKFLSDQGGFDHIIRGSRATGGGAMGARVTTQSPQQKAPQEPRQAGGFGLK